MVVKIYTDGACSGNPGPGGWASAFVESGKDIVTYAGHDKNTTNNRMELLAVVESLSIASKRYRGDVNIEIYSDSAYVVNAINNNWLDKWKLNNWKTANGEDVKNYDLWSKFLALLSNIKTKGQIVTFNKVKGHAGNPLNEYVDKMARNEVYEAIRKV